jgi:serine/threonine protein kinase
VVLAKAKEDGKLFALKVMSKQAIKQQDKVDQVLLERDISKATNDHPFLVGLCFAFHTMSSVYIGMEFVQGGELFTLLVRKRWLPEDEARFYLAEIALGIDHLHKQGIVWRDLKPENVLIATTGHVKIVDFGIAKTGVNKTSGARTFCGTAEYFAPESDAPSSFEHCVEHCTGARAGAATGRAEHPLRHGYVMLALNCSPLIVRPQLFALNCLPSTVCPQTNTQFQPWTTGQWAFCSMNCLLPGPRSCTGLGRSCST